jgi:hypothetical protein
MKPCICIMLSALLAGNSFAAVRGDSAAYVGGTVSTLKQGVEGVLDTSDEKELRFDYKDGQFSLPYLQIVTLEFGQKVGRRVGAAIGGMVALGLPGLLILMSKKKKHFLTIGYRNEAGEGQAAVFELAKGTVSDILPSLEARTGKRVEQEAGDGFEIGHAEAPHVPAPPPALIAAPVTTLTVQSNPPGAEVIIDAKSYGPAPVTASVPSGSNYVFMRRDGFENWTKEIDAKAGESLTINGELKKKIEETPYVIVVKPSK